MDVQGIALRKLVDVRESMRENDTGLHFECTVNDDARDRTRRTGVIIPVLAYFWARGAIRLLHGEDEVFWRGGWGVLISISVILVSPCSPGHVTTPVLRERLQPLGAAVQGIPSQRVLLFPAEEEDESKNRPIILHNEAVHLVKLKVRSENLHLLTSCAVLTLRTT